MKISVLTPSFNSGKHIVRAIESVLKQDYQNWEHIIQDGGSADNTIDILKQYSHLKWVSEKDDGQSDAMNKAFDKSTGDLIIYLNSDDECFPGLFSRIVEEFQKDARLKMLVCDLQVNKSTKEIRRVTPSVNLDDILYYWNYKFPLNPVSYVYIKSLQKKIGPFPVDNHYAMDYWFLLRAYLYCLPRKIDFISGIFYFDGSNKSADAQRSSSELKMVKEDFIRRFMYHPPVAWFVVKDISKRARNKVVSIFR